MGKRELLFSITKKDFKIDYFSGTGAGGQHRNKHQNCVRLTHKASGVVVKGQSNRERTTNLRDAFQSLVNHPKFKVWHTRIVNEITQGKTIEETVTEMLDIKNLKVEGKSEDNKWKELEAK